MDLISTGFIKKEENDVTAYTYGALRIGDSNFSSLLNNYIYLYRVIKDNDFVVRAPNCYYSVLGKVWRCMNEDRLAHKIDERGFPLREYFIGYDSPVVINDIDGEEFLSFLQGKKKQIFRPEVKIDHVFYSPPIGNELFYTSNMDRFVNCRFINGISNCEKKLSLPETFSSSSHHVYYDINFNEC
jgi:hypothetical protein